MSPMLLLRGHWAYAGHEMQSSAFLTDLQPLL